MRRPEDGVWRGSPVIMAALAATFVAVSAFAGLLVGMLVWKLRGENLYDRGGEIAIGVVVALALVALSAYLLSRHGYLRVVVGSDTVEVFQGEKRLHRFPRAQTTFHSMVNRNFINGVRGPGSKRMLIATPLGGVPDEKSGAILASSTIGFRLGQRSDDTLTALVQLRYFGRRRFALLIDELRTASTTVNLDETRTIALTRAPSISLDRGTDDPGKLLPQPARRMRGDVFGSTLDLGRRAILLRALIFFATLAGTVAISVWLRTSPVLPESVKSVLIFVVFLGFPSALFFAIRLAWLALRIPRTVTVDRECIRLGRRRYEFTDIAEISLNPPSYAEHMRTLTVRSRRGIRRSWMLGHDQPGNLARQGFPQYGAFATAIVTAAAASSTALVWDLE